MPFADLPIGICVADTRDGIKHFVTLVSNEAAFSRGLPPEAIVGVLRRPLQQGEAITVDNFVCNSSFVDFLHRVIAAHGPAIPDIVAEAKSQGDGWAYVIDGRTPTPADAVPPEDVIGAFQVSREMIVAASYQRNENHVVLSPRGFMRLDEKLQQHLLAFFAANG